MFSLIKAASENTFKIISPFFKDRSNYLLISRKTFYDRGRIGNREVVGYGRNGRYEYEDNSLFPFPAIRFKEPSPEICALREKERGDWRNLTCEEKKCLYRASFCYTYAEFQYSNPVWKLVVGGTCMVIALALFIQFFFYDYFVYKEYPETFSRERRTAQYNRQIQMRVNPVTGLGSRYDYERDEFKPGYKW